MAVVHKRHKEAIHSGHFMVSNFEAEAQDDNDDIAIPASIYKTQIKIWLKIFQVPEEASAVDTVPDVAVQEGVQNQYR